MSDDQKRLQKAIDRKLELQAERRRTREKPVKLRVDADGNVYGPNGTLLGKAAKR